MLPQAFLDRIREIIPTDVLHAVLSSFCVPKPVTFRVNSLKMTADDLASALAFRGIPAARIPWYADAFMLGDVSQKVLTATDLYAQGMLYVQSLSSMIPPLVLDPKPEETVLDLTAAPGSKTTQMAAMMKNTGTIVANDRSRVRTYKLDANLKTQGVINTTVTRLPGEILWQQYAEHFDKALVDVPCSLEGTFLCSYPKSFQGWTPKKVNILSKMQKFLLRSAVSATKPDGMIVYSTCTLEPEENEAVIDWLIKKEKGNVVIASFSSRSFPEMTEGLTSWKGRTYDQSIMNTRRILPSATMEGFFVAKLRKIASTVPSGYHAIRQ